MQFVLTCFGSSLLLHTYCSYLLFMVHAWRSNKKKKSAETKISRTICQTAFVSALHVFVPEAPVGISTQPTTVWVAHLQCLQKLSLTQGHVSAESAMTEPLLLQGMSGELLLQHQGDARPVMPAGHTENSC